MTAPDEPTDQPTPAPAAPADDLAAARKALARDLALYTAARLGLVALVVVVVLGAGALLGAEIPLLVAFVVGVVVALPLSLVLLTGLRTRVGAGMAVVGARRQTDKAELRARLRGDETAP